MSLSKPTPKLGRHQTAGFGRPKSLGPRRLQEAEDARPKNEEVADKNLEENLLPESLEPEQFDATTPNESGNAGELNASNPAVEAVSTNLAQGDEPEFPTSVPGVAVSSDANERAATQRGPESPIVGSIGVVTGLDDLIAAAAGLTSEDHRTARDLVYLAKQRKLPFTEVALLRQQIIDATGWDAPILTAIAKDADNYQEQHGFISGADELARAFLNRIAGSSGRVVACEGCLWHYPIGAQYWRPLPLDVAEKEMQRAFPTLPAARKPSDRQEAYRRACALCAVDEEFFTAAEPGINLSNGFLRLDRETGQVALLPHDPDHRARYQLEVAYHPKARAEAFSAGVARILGGAQEKLLCFLQFLAVSLFGFMPARDDVRSVMVLYGPQRAGKSTLIRLLQRMVPEYSQASIPPELWGDERHRARLRNIRLNTVTELDFGGKAISGPNFKLIASREPVTAREVYAKAVTFTPQAVHLFACNQLPVIGERDPSLERRLIVLRVERTLTDAELNPRFIEDAWAEAPGIINLLAEQAETLWRTGRFDLPKDNKELVLRMQFRDRPEELLARLWIEQAAGHRIWSSELQEALRVLAEDLGMDTREWSAAKNMRALVQRLRDLYGAERRAVDGRPFYEGVRIKAEYQTKVQSEPHTMSAGIRVVDLDDL